MERYKNLFDEDTIINIDTINIENIESIEIEEEEVEIDDIDDGEDEVFEDEDGGFNDINEPEFFNDVYESVVKKN